MVCKLGPLANLGAEPPVRPIADREEAPNFTGVRDSGWNAGVMVWEFPDASWSWIQAVRASSFPV
ncbi:hypothetical protein BT96DRAFT_978359 [Gymnopus androsaceus JB14]|uniref:Uncharacterized protein n=1 Tax=Gymnopus androsaceus JB14 TaxID=1447944 RepID=A0A6A4H926_9AGAR|nr:hypothetical protein BT96DRAFT_978359 [Gymnopus androsaceus JB14]